MKQLKVIIQPDRLGIVKKALSDIGIKGLNIGRTEGFTQDRTRKQTVRSTEYNIDVVRMGTIETVIEDEVVGRAIEAITNTAQTGQFGDGRIFVSEVLQAVNIRNGDTGVAAITRSPVALENGTTLAAA